MKVSDYIVEYLIRKGITDVFGYPGGMVTHLMDSFEKYQDKIAAHVTYHEQGASLAACGYAQVTGKPGVAYATSGPGATNMVTGICNAWYDSIPVIFLTGQVNRNELMDGLPLRQRGFQETDIVTIVRSVTKYAAQVDSPEKIDFYLDKAFESAMTGRRGPVLLDIPMDVFRAEIPQKPVLSETAAEDTVRCQNEPFPETAFETLKEALEQSRRPCILLGGGVKSLGYGSVFRDFIDRWKIPAVTSMIARDVLGVDEHNYGFLGAYGSRTANFIAAKCDLLITVGSRLNVRQVGADRAAFAPDAKIIRFDVDPGELVYRVHEDEIQFCQDLAQTAAVFAALQPGKDYTEWITVCDEIRSTLENIDTGHPGGIIRKLSEFIPPDTVITTDVGQNQVWVPQFLQLKSGQTLLFSGGHAPMGCSLPQAIGACYANGKKPVLCFSGDGGMQMNIQELQYVAREQLPIKIVILNNNSLGMIRHFQEIYFDGVYAQTVPEHGYSAPDFQKIGEAYGIRSRRVTSDSPEEFSMLFEDSRPLLLDVIIGGNTYVYPKLVFGKPNQDQEPPLSRELYEKIMSL